MKRIHIYGLVAIITIVTATGYASTHTHCSDGNCELKNNIAIAIWPADKEGINTEIPETIKPPKNRYSNIFNPTITVVKPEAPNGSSMIICPGGAYSFLCVDKEGIDVAKEFIKSGVTCFVLKYRLPKTPGAKFEHPATVSDAQRAIKYIRYHSKKWNLDPERIGIMGFSAGGHLASTAMTLFDKPVYTTGEIASISCRPDFAVLVYPVINTYTKGIMHYCPRKLLPGNKAKEISSELNVTANCPPTMLVHAQDDKPVNPQNSILMHDALKAAGVATELKIYKKGGHGFGVGRPNTDSTNWILDTKTWLKKQGIIQ